jgi:outer membrane protein TolC
MSGISFFRVTIPFVVLSFVSACQTADFAEIKPKFDHVKEVPASFFNGAKKSLFGKNNRLDRAVNDSPMPLKNILDNSLANKNQGTDFITSLKYALDTDPDIISRRRDIEARRAAIESSRAQKDFQVGTTIYGGIEDITDNTKGVALALNASRVVFDGGRNGLSVKNTSPCKHK